MPQGIDSIQEGMCRRRFHFHGMKARLHIDAAAVAVSMRIWNLWNLCVLGDEVNGREFLHSQLRDAPPESTSVFHSRPR